MEASIASDLLRSEVVSSGSYHVLDRANMSSILAEQSFQQSGCTDSACAVQLGQLLNMEFMIYGMLLKAGTVFYLAVDMISVETSQIVKSAKVKMDGIDGLEGAVKQVVTEITGIAPQKKTTSLVSEGFGVVSITSQPMGCEVVIDGKPAGSTRYFKELKTGKYQVIIRKDGFLPKSFELEVEEGATREINVILREGVGIEESTSKADRHRRGVKRNALLLSGSAVLFGGGYAGGLLLNRRGQKLYTSYMNAPSSDDAESLGDQYTRTYNAADALYIASECGVAFAGVSLTWLLVDLGLYKKFKKLKEMAQVKAVLTPERKALVLTFQF